MWDLVLLRRKSPTYKRTMIVLLLFTTTLVALLQVNTKHYV